MGTLPVALATMTAGEVRMEHAEARERAIATELVSQAYYVQSGPYLDNGRNDVVRTFCDPAVRERCTHLLMVDSDIAFNNEQVIALFEASEQRAVVGGVYSSVYDGVPRPVVYDWSVDEHDRKTLSVIKEWEDGWEPWPVEEPGGFTAKEKGLDPLIKVEAIGAGFLMIRYEVIDVLAELFKDEQPWFSEPVEDGIHYGEDLAFCQRVKNAGFSVWAHRGVEPTHIKPILLGPGV